MPISTMDQLVAALATAQQLPFHRGTSFNPDASFLTAGAFHYPRDGSSNRVIGFPGIAPISGVTRNANIPLTGGPSPTGGHSLIPFRNPTGGNKLYVGAVQVAANQPGLLMLADVLVVWRNNTGATSPVSLGSGFKVPDAPDVRNYNGGAGVQVWMEQYLQVNSGTITLTYTNSDGTGSRSSAASPFPTNGGGEQNFLHRIGLAAGDSGVRSVQSIAWTGAAGENFGIVMLRPIVALPVTNQSQVYDFTEMGLPEVASGAALQTIFQPSSSTGPVSYSGNITLIEG